MPTVHPLPPPSTHTPPVADAAKNAVATASASGHGSHSARRADAVVTRFLAAPAISHWLQLVPGVQIARHPEVPSYLKTVKKVSHCSYNTRTRVNKINQEKEEETVSPRHGEDSRALDLVFLPVPPVPGSTPCAGTSCKEGDIESGWLGG